MKKLLLTLIIMNLCACTGTNTPGDDTNPSWAGKMQKTALSFKNLLPFLYNQEKFSDKKNRGEISQLIAEYKKSIHQIDRKSATQFLGDDPYVLQSLDSLHELTDRASESFARGDTKNSNILLKATANTCFKCHTRQDMGPQTIYWKNFNVDALNTSAIDKAHLLVSMRQYEEAKLHLVNFLNESETTQQFDVAYENALHYYLMISLRGQKTFKSALNFIQSKILVAKTPTEVHYNLRHWAEDLKYWDKNQHLLKPTYSSAENVLKRNKKRYSEKNLINNLIASSLLHQYLIEEKNKSKQAKAYYLLGHIYDELVIEGFWDLPEVYYENCIRYSPQTPLAQVCFKRFKNNITLGYSGSHGTMIPVKEYERIEELRKISGLK